MCHSGCFYENAWGDCKGRPSGHITVTPHCFEDDDVESYNESVDETKILNWELDRADRQDHWDNAMEDRRISNR